MSVETTGRVRGNSAAEEANVTSFVQSCVAFEANVKYFDFQGLQGRSSNILLVLQEGKIEEGLSAFGALPFWSKVIEQLVRGTSTGSLRSSTIFTDLANPSAENAVRITVGVVPATASRHNCALRPDALTGFVKDTLAAEGSAECLDIFIGVAGAELPYAGAIAKGAHRTFSAKRRDWQHAYMAKNRHPIRAFFPHLKASAEGLFHVATSIQLSMRLIDAPTNLLDTTTFAEIATTYVKNLGQSIAFDYRGEDLRENGFGGVYGVGKAAEFPPALIGLHYRPSEDSGITPKQKLALVGKGIVYDTGGLSIKPGTGMCSMKCDMGGAAIVFCSWLMAVRLRAPYEVNCVLCLADNAVGPRSFRNDDILLLKSGLSVEINNTDAEGRLVLADGVFIAGSFKPDCIIDMATLTGAQGIATGTKHAAIHTNSDEWEGRFFQAGRTCGDMVFPLLFCPEFHTPEFSSKVADHRNSVRNRSNAQASCAGQFIHNNLAADFKGAHVHIDLAAPAFQGEAATGYGVTLMAQVLGEGIVA